MKITQDTLISIYDAALSDQNWNRALDACATSMGAKIGLFYEFSTMKQVEYSLEKACSNTAQINSIVSEYNEIVKGGTGSGYDMEGIPFIHNTPQWSVVRDDEIWDLTGAYLERPEIVIPLKADLFRRSFLNLSDDPSSMRGLVFLYDRGVDRQLPTDKLGNGPVFGPHVSKAAEIFRLTSGLRRKYNAALSVLDQIDTGVVVVTDTAEIVVANRAASRILEARDGLYASRSNTLTPLSETAETLLLQSISEVSATAKGENDRSGQIVALPKRSSDTSLIAVVSPLRDAEMEIDKGLTGALVTLIDPMRPVTIQADIVATAYGLTKAEARVADLLLQGLTNTEISERIGVGPETIKSQISSVLAKSGCKSRVSFIWRVFQLSPPIR